MTTADKAPATQPDPLKRTKWGSIAHWFTEPVRLEDREKKKLEENPPPAPEPPKNTCEKSFGCITVTCGDATAAKPVDAKEEVKGKGDEAGSLTSIVVKVLGAIATGVGVTGAVVVVGAAIFWARFDAIGLPATQAVTAIPRTELLVQGAQEMILFVLVGLGAALLIVFADPKGIITRGTLIVLGALVGGAAIYAIFTALSWGWVLGLIGLASVFALLAIGIGIATGQRLLPLLVSVFIASFLFSASCAFLIVEQQRYAQAIAIQFGPKAKAEKGITGIYVTATEKTIFFARSDLAGAADAGLYEIPRAETTTYAVGRLEPIVEDETNPVQESAEALLRSLKVDAESFPPPEAAATTKDTPALAK